MMQTTIASTVLLTSTTVKHHITAIYAAYFGYLSIADPTKRTQSSELANRQ
jgi:hypothetical protein